MPKKIFLIACEASGDAHAAHLIEEWKKIEPDTIFRGLGGPLMAGAGLALLQDMTKISALGFGDVIRQYGTYRKYFYQALADLKQWQPDALVLVDSPAFNLRFAKKVRQYRKNFDILYYICPQIWAWGGRRIHTVRKTITKMFSILPFEVDFYRNAGLDCEYVGHPLLERARWDLLPAEARKQLSLPTDTRLVGLLPGSRKSEVERILPIMAAAALALQKELPDLVFYMAASSNVERAVYDNVLNRFPIKIERFSDRMDEHLRAFDFALVASGTATLQTALANTPNFLLYKASWTTYFLGRQLIRVPYLGLVNLLAGKSVVPEFIQWAAHPGVIAREARILLSNRYRYDTMKRELFDACSKLGKEGASRKAAKLMASFLARRQNAAMEIPAAQ